MNKYIIIGILLVLIVAGGAWFKSSSDKFRCAPTDGIDRELTVVSKRLEWHFEPDVITVNQCDRLKLTVINEDDFDHGFAIDAFGISQRLPANETIKIEFTATQSGEFPFYCSVSCGNSNDSSFGLPDGKVQTGKFKGQIRGHFDHVSRFIVRAIELLTGQETQ